jgi:hypothetical protein
MMIKLWNLLVLKRKTTSLSSQNTSSSMVNIEVESIESDSDESTSAKQIETSNDAIHKPKHKLCRNNVNKKKSFPDTDINTRKAASTPESPSRKLTADILKTSSEKSHTYFVNLLAVFNAVQEGKLSNIELTDSTSTNQVVKFFVKNPLYLLVTKQGEDFGKEAVRQATNKNTKLYNLKLQAEENITNNRCGSNATKFAAEVNENYLALQNDTSKIIEKIMQFANENKYQYSTEPILLPQKITYLSNQNTSSPMENMQTETSDSDESVTSENTIPNDTLNKSKRKRRLRKNSNGNREKNKQFSSNDYNTKRSRNQY